MMRAPTLRDVAQVAGVEERLRAAGKSLIITSGGYLPENERSAVERLTNRRVAGMILTPTSTSTAATREMLEGDEPPTAIISANARSSLGVIRALHQDRPCVVAHVSFDDVDGAASLSPPVTVIHQDPVGMGRAAPDLLFQRLADPSGPSRHVLLPTRSIGRGSGEMPPCDRS
jgi:DNA-binding LacI/PurR family transcriptional regulator